MMNATNAPDSEVNADNGPPCLEALPKFTLAVGDFQLQQQSVDGGLASLGTFHDPDENDLARLISPPGGADLWGISRYASPIIMNSNDGSPLEPPAQREKDYLVSQASSLSIIDKNSAPESKRRPLEERARWFLPMTMTLSYCIPALITASKKGGNTSASDVDSLITSDQVNQSFRELKKCLWPRQNCHLQSPMSSCPVEPFGDEGSSSTNSSVLNTKKNCEKEPQKRRSLRLAILLSISGDYWALIACVISSACQFVMVALLDWVTEFVSNEDEAHWHGYGYAALALFLSVTQSVAKAQIGRASGHMQAKLHGSIAMLMMERLCDETPKGSISSVLEVASNAGENSKTAKFMEEKSVVVDEYINEEDSPVVQLLTSDVEAIAEMVPMLLFGAVNMLDIVIAFTYLLVVVGWPGLCPIAVFILLVPANKFISDRFVDSYDDKSTAADARSRKVEEVLSYIRTIKYYAWEAIMERDISALRNTEVKVLKGLMGYLMAFSGIVAVAAPLMQLSLFVAIYFGPANEGRLDGSMIYQCIALISTASWHLSIVPYEVSEWSRVSVAVRRVERFLFSLTTAVNDLDLDDDALDEVGEDQQMNPDAEFPKPTNAAAVGTVDLQHVSFIHQAKASVTYSPSGEPTSDNERSVSSPTQNFKSDAFIVRVPQLSIQPGELAMIVGKVGSGKSSLASAVMGQMCPIQSAEFCQRFDVSGRISIVPQTPWILNGTVRNNIILGSEFNDDRYKKVLRASALALDLSLFSNGDATVVGPKGVTLSGGQRQRISIARALYREADIYIFDDSLSALDAAVGRQVFESAIKEFLSTKTRILVTHQLSYLPLADKIVVVSDGCVTQAQLPEFVAIEPEENEEPIAELLRGWRFVLDALETSQATNNTANVHLNSSTNDESVGLPTHHGSFDVTTPIRRTTLTPAAAAQIYQSSRAVGAPFTLEGGDGQREEILIGEASVTHLPAPAVLSPSNIHIPNVLSCAPSGETSPQLTFATESHPVSPSRGTLRLPTFAILGAIGNLDNETMTLSGTSLTRSRQSAPRCTSPKCTKNRGTQLLSPMSSHSSTAFRAVTISPRSPATRLKSAVQSPTLRVARHSSSTTLRTDSHVVDVVANATTKIDEDPTIEHLVSTPVHHSLAKYLRCVGGFFFWFWMVILHFATVAFSVWATWWLGQWAEGETYGLEEKSGSLAVMGAYAAALLVSAIIVLLREILWRSGAVHPPLKLYTSMTRAILAAPIAFFDTNPIGRIINRFTKDFEDIDYAIPTATNELLISVAAQVGSLVAICIAVPYFTPVAVVILVIVPLLRPSQSLIVLRRVSDAALSPVTGLFTEAYIGGTSIAVLQLAQLFKDRLQLALDDFNSIRYMDKISFQFVKFRIAIIMSIIGAGVIVVMTILKSSTSPATAGFVISQTITITNFIDYMVDQLGTLTLSINSVARVAEYEAIPPEHGGDVQPHSSWPAVPSVELRNVCAQYRPELPVVIQNLSLSLKPAERIGVCGRTGSGKSTLIQCLLRMVPLLEGSNIIIDGIETSSIPLPCLRRRMTVIPQEPVIFEGTLRYNLDPEGTLSDRDLMDALDECHVLSNLAPGYTTNCKSWSLCPTVDLHCVELENVAEDANFAILDSEISQDSLSLGQKQLVCLARARLRGTNILILDEATSSVDAVTDQLIQTVIRSAFHKCTVITIAHRINTIIGSDRVLVLDKGIAVEFDTPSALLNDKTSHFSQLVKRSKEEH